MEHLPKKVALVHDFLLTFGGAERVLKVLSEMYPEAPIYTLLANKEITEKYFPGRVIRTSFLQKFPRFLRKHYRLLLPFYPVAIETLDLRNFDLVVSSCGAWSKGIVTRLNTRHISYLHSPMRFAWDSFHAYGGIKGKQKIFRRLLLSYLRLWDKEAAARPDILIANSEYTRDRIRKFYRLDAQVIYPPLSNLPQSENKEKKNFFLVVSRLTTSKRVETVIEAFNKLGLPLLVIGSGPERKRLEKIAEKNITFLGRVEDTELARLYTEARALIQPSEEDFGLVVIEALASGTPVIANEKGASREIFVPGQTGELFGGETAEALADGVRRFVEGNEKAYDFEAMRRTVERFSQEKFRQSIRSVERDVFEDLETKNV